jgi:hypothetical protein
MTNTIIDIESILGKPTIIATIQACGPWDLSDYAWDPYYDISKAIRCMPVQDTKFHLLMNNHTRQRLNALNSNYIPFYKEILPLLLGNMPKEIGNVDLYDLFKGQVIKISSKVPENICLVISENLNVVVIET